MPPRLGVSTYSEKLLVGYRYYDHHKIEFSTGAPFGHGLSYTSFAYTALGIRPQRTVSFRLTNTGHRAGAEVAQLYLSYPAHVGEPPRQLRGFQKVLLAAGEEQEVHFMLTERDLSIWDDKAHHWQLVHGKFGVFVGASSRDLQLTGNMDI